MVQAVMGLIKEIKRCEASGATAAAVAMAFICIDTMAFLALPAGREKQCRSDFIAWVDDYLKGDEDQLYQYSGIDVYGARCALLHAFGTETDYHQKCPDAKRFAYHDGGRHVYDPAVDEYLVIIGTASFLNDVVHAILAFAEAWKADHELCARVTARLPKVLATVPIQEASLGGGDDEC